MLCSLKTRYQGGGGLNIRTPSAPFLVCSFNFPYLSISIANSHVHANELMTSYNASATSERTFSALKCVMTDVRLNNGLILHIH